MDKNISETILVNFDNLKDTRLKIKQSFNEIDIIKKSIKQNYIQYIEQENTNFFGLDSFIILYIFLKISSNDGFVK